MEDDAPVIYGLEFQVSMAESVRCRLCLALTRERPHSVWFQGFWASRPGFGERVRVGSVAK